ncbi:MAG: hypothetical protein A2475_12950 [Ignavibacteria bacterium RIFOXYC2_FULL_35_21]|nr:MAG: hypothetical protein A2220_00240 [Ignavibacteria bacterium RIFOXYA2_FULL_35_10]OGV18884.1 MAG: hypothetical protein A2475_12950 [Ignavibacteria bacterium RIFOXYC2_FULL_35_21]
MKTIIIILAAIFTLSTGVYAQPDYPYCYNYDGTCLNWSQWECQDDLFLKLDGISYIPLQDCFFQVSGCWRYCLNDPSNWQVNLKFTGPRDDFCVDAFYDYLYGPNHDQPLDPVRARELWFASYKSLAKWVLQNKGLQFGNFDCTNVPVTSFFIKEYSPGSCTMLCFYLNGSGKPTFKEIPCIQEFCCGTEWVYCMDYSVNPPVVRELAEFHISEGITECLISPEPPIELCPEGSYDATRCYSDCVYPE